MWKELKQQIRFLFTFTLGERRGIIALTIILLLMLGVMKTMPLWVKPAAYPPLPYVQLADAWMDEQDSVQAQHKKKKFYRKENLPDTATFVKAPPAVMFAFDPNTFTEQDAQALGLSQRQVRNIFNYRSHGGLFRKKADFARLYSMDTATYQRLLPYLLLPDTVARKDKPRFVHKADSSWHTTPFSRFKRAIVELNSADSATLVSLRGIGPSFASRIIRYRNRLGGFFNLEQLKEVWGVTDSLLLVLKPQVQVNPGLVQKVQINTITYDQLKNHPYLRYNSARAIINYRDQHGRFSSIGDMGKIVLLPDTTLTKLAPYIEF